MTKCEKAGTFFKEMDTFELYSGVERKYWGHDSGITSEEHSYAVRRKAESKAILYELLLGE